MDPNNPVVKLCVEGMQAEGQSRLDDAHKLFMQAWTARQDDFDACVAAHYVARHQASPAEMLRWNQVALQHADAVNADRVANFYPSLYLNMGWSYETLGNLAEANRYYTLAAEKLDCLPAGPYGNVVRQGVAGGQARVAQAEQDHPA